MRTRLTFWKIFLARNVGQDVKLSLIYTLGWLGLKDSQGVRFLAAVRAQLSCIVLSSWVLLQLFSLSSAGRTQHCTAGRRVLYWGEKQRVRALSSHRARDSLASQSGLSISRTDQSGAALAAVSWQPGPRWPGPELFWVFWPQPRVNMWLQF